MQSSSEFEVRQCPKTYEWAEVALGFVLGPFALLVVALCNPKASLKFAVMGWLMGWLVLAFVLTSLVGERNAEEERVRQVEEKGWAEEYAEWVRAEEQRQKETEDADRRREEQEKEKVAAARLERERRNVLETAQSLREQDLDLRNTINSILSGRRYPGFKPSEIHSIDSSLESMVPSGFLGPVAEDASVQELSDLVEKLMADRDRLAARLSNLEAVWQKLKAEARRPCAKCHGEGAYAVTNQCSVCKGTGQVDVEYECPSCQGAGATERCTVCPKCRGKGIDSGGCPECRGSGMVKCASCDGKGGTYEREYKKGLNGSNMALRKKFIRCVHCEGRGKVRCSRCANSPCPKCDGTGEIKKLDVCQKCRGKGKLLRKQSCPGCEKGNVESRQKCEQCHGRGWTSPLEP